jgi:membrane-bound lytic murein transglycosylase D
MSCTSARETTEQVNYAATARPASLVEWEDQTRRRADDLMAEAQHLQTEGRIQEALARTDDALCLLFDSPPGYDGQSTYLDYLAELIEEADDLQAAMQPLEEDLEMDEELVILPPIDIFATEVESVEIVAESPLPDSDFPLVLNGTVESFLEAMASPTEYHRRIETGLGRAGTYLPMIRSKFGEAGLPLDLAYLPLIESAFSVKAYSRARAHGMWQFISSTGRHYGLEVGSLVDERRDPVRSTEAAVAYLGDLYGEFDDWYLALAAYNSGAGNVRRAIRRSGSRDFWTLRRNLPRETRNYVPAFIASVIVAKHPAKYGFSAPQDRPWTYDTIEVPDALDLQFLASKSGIDIEVLRDLNPAIRRDLTPARGNITLRLPPGTYSSAEEVLASTPRDEWAPRMIHTVRRGESLSVIASRYGSSVSAIRQANGLRGSLIRPGQELVVPRFDTPMRTARHQPRRTSENGSYVVQANDTLWDISRAFSVSLNDLCAVNGLSKRSVIRPGQRLNLPGGAQPVRVTAPLTTSTYTVRKGDTLSDIANRSGTSVEELRNANGISGSRIHPGTELRIPDSKSATPSGRTASVGTTYRVRKGDTLYDIARRFGTSISALRRANGLRSSRIYPGDVLQIPPSEAKG